MASISSGFAAQQRMHQTARQRTASAPLVMRQLDLSTKSGSKTRSIATPSAADGAGFDGRVSFEASLSSGVSH